MNHVLTAASAVVCVATTCAAQSLFQVPPPMQTIPPAPTSPSAPGQPADSAPVQAVAQGAPSLEQVGLFVVKPVAPKTWQMHDKVEIIINETSMTKFEQSLDTKKSYDMKAELSQFPSLASLFEQMIYRPSVQNEVPKVGVKSSHNFKGDGTYERKENLTARISGLVIDVKPNGMLVVEAKESVESDDETKTMVLSGMVDPKDVTNTGTVQSAQMANLVIRIEHEGQVKKAGEKGFIPRVFEAVFNF